MELTHTSSRLLETLHLKGALTAGSLVTLTTALSKHVQEYPGRDLALELSEVTTIDQSGMRLVSNLGKRLATQGGTLYIVAPRPTVRQTLSGTGPSDGFTVVDEMDHIDRRKANDVFEECREHATLTGPWLSLRCSCPVCGSDQVSAYLIDITAYRWRWNGTERFPTAYLPDTDTPAEVFGHLPSVCLDCYMASIDVSDFNVLSGGHVVRHSIMGEGAKALLAKAIKKRKKLMEIGVAVGDTFFDQPRDARACYQACLLASSCSRSLAVDRKRANPFAIGYLHYLTLRFADGEAEHLDSCRTWFNQALTDSQPLTPSETALAYYVMFLTDHNRGKKKEASQIYTTFAAALKGWGTAGSDADNDIASPHFWFSQADRIWHEEIKEKSREMRLHE